MRIGLVRRGFSRAGGAEKYLLRFAEALAEHGHEPVLFACERWPENVWPHGDIRRVSGTGKGPKNFADALRALEPKKHCDFLYSLERVWECDAYRAGDGVHRAWLERRSRYENFLRRFFRRVNPKHLEMMALEKALFLGDKNRLFVTNSNMVKEEIRTHYGIEDESRLCTIYNGFDAEKVDPAQAAEVRKQLRGSLKLAEKDVAVLFCGSGWDRKGLRFAVQALEAVDDPRLKLVVAGRGNPKGYEREFTTFLGPVSNVPELCVASDVFILPTIYDPFSNATLEASAYGLPVITTRGNGFGELLALTEFGTVVEAASDVEALAKGLKRWLPEEARPGELRGAIADWAGLLSMERNVEETLKFFEPALGEKFGVLRSAPI